jgi:hypothetical protein
MRRIVKTELEVLSCLNTALPMVEKARERETEDSRREILEAVHILLNNVMLDIREKELMEYEARQHKKGDWL